MKKSNPKQRFRPRHTIFGLLAIAGALGGIALVSQPAPASRPTHVGKLQAVASPFPIGPNALEPVVVAQAPLAPEVLGHPLKKDTLTDDDLRRSLLAAEVLGPTDRCVIEAPRVDDRFSFTPPQVDDRFVVKPLVQGLPVSSRTTR